MSVVVSPETDVIVVDVETTGVDADKNAVLLIAVAVCDLMMNVRASRVFQLRPFAGAVIEPKAMEVNGLKIEDTELYPHASITLKAFNSFIHQHCLKSPRFALWYCWGVGFDDRFMLATFKREGIEWYGRRTWNCMRGLATHLNLYSSFLTGVDKSPTKGVAEFMTFLGEEFSGKQHDPLADVLNSIRVIRLSMARLLRAAQSDEPWKEEKKPLLVATEKSKGDL